MHFLFTSPRNDQLGENNMNTKNPPCHSATKSERKEARNYMKEKKS